MNIRRMTDEKSWLSTGGNPNPINEYNYIVTDFIAQNETKNG